MPPGAVSWATRCRNERGSGGVVQDLVQHHHIGRLEGERIGHEVAGEVLRTLDALGASGRHRTLAQVDTDIAIEGEPFEAGAQKSPSHTRCRAPRVTSFRAPCSRRNQAM